MGIGPQCSVPFFIFVYSDTLFETVSMNTIYIHVNAFSCTIDGVTIHYYLLRPIPQLLDNHPVFKSTENNTGAVCCFVIMAVYCMFEE